jgi:GDPmannose 4,6-dehydratase
MQWLMLQQEAPEDFVIATGEQHSVRALIDAAAVELGFDLSWEGEGLDEKGIDARSNKTIVAVDRRYFRPTEVDTLLGDASKARDKLGWQPRIAFGELVKEMAAEDLREAERDALCQKEGFRTFNHFE